MLIASFLSSYGYVTWVFRGLNWRSDRDGTWVFNYRHLALSQYDSIYILPHSAIPCNSSIICVWLRRCFVGVRELHIQFYCIYHFNRYSTTDSRKFAPKYTPSWSCVFGSSTVDVLGLGLSALEISSN